MLTTTTHHLYIITSYVGSFSSRIGVNVFPVLPDNKDDRNCTEMNNLLVCSASLPGKIDCINVKMNDVTIYDRSANL